MAKKLTLKPGSEAFILDRLQFENPWWVSGEIDTDYKKLSS